jgi:hypothetical protein
MYCIVLFIKLFSKVDVVVVDFEKLTGLRVPSTAIDGNRMISVLSNKHPTESIRQQTCFFLELYFVREFDRFLVQLVATHSQMYLGLTCNIVLITMYSDILFFLVVEDIVL